MRKDRSSLGLDSAITRRDFIGGALAGSGALLLSMPAPAFAQGLTSGWNGNVASVVNAAHGVRDGIYEAGLASAPLADEPCDLIIVAGGFAGMIAAYDFHKAHPNKKCLVLDNHPVFGGEAKQNQIRVDGLVLTGPQGSNDTGIPAPGTSYAHVSDLWDEIGMPRHFDVAEPVRAAQESRRALKQVLEVIA